MRALVTGASGTVGQTLVNRLRERGSEVVGWDRATVPIDRYDAMDRFVAECAPDVVYNLAIASRMTGRENEAWVVNYEWPSELAWICRQRRIRFVQASTVMVFSGTAHGPFTPDSVPDEERGYGHEKRMAEERVRHQYPEATIARLGWQIGQGGGTNNMLDYFERQTIAEGEVRASVSFVPACSFLEDTVEALVKMPDSPPGLYMLDSNEGWSLFEIAEALNAKHGGKWSIVRSESLRAERTETSHSLRSVSFTQDQRMLDPRLGLPSLRARLPALRELHRP